MSKLRQSKVRRESVTLVSAKRGSTTWTEDGQHPMLKLSSSLSLPPDSPQIQPKSQPRPLSRAAVTVARPRLAGVSDRPRDPAAPGPSGSGPSVVSAGERAPRVDADPPAPDRDDAVPPEPPVLDPRDFALATPVRSRPAAPAREGPPPPQSPQFVRGSSRQSLGQQRAYLRFKIAEREAREWQRMEAASGLVYFYHAASDTTAVEAPEAWRVWEQHAHRRDWALELEEEDARATLAQEQEGAWEGMGRAVPAAAV